MHLKKNFKIYLLDDNVFSINIFQQHLYNLGYTDTTVFCDPAACLDELDPPPTIIFFDCGSDFELGLDILKKVKKHNPGIYLVFICGSEEVDRVVDCLKYGAFDYFVKGEDDVKNLEMVLLKIYRVKELLKKKSINWLDKFNTINLQ